MAMDILPRSKHVERNIPDSLPGLLQGNMEIETDPQGMFMITVTCPETGSGASIYLNKSARLELARILLDTL